MTCQPGRCPDTDRLAGEKSCQCSLRMCCYRCQAQATAQVMSGEAGCPSSALSCSLHVQYYRHRQWGSKARISAGQTFVARCSRLSAWPLLLLANDNRGIVRSLNPTEVCSADATGTYRLTVLLRRIRSRVGLGKSGDHGTLPQLHRQHPDVRGLACQQGCKCCAGQAHLQS